jgi:large subunit ribosomal protein L35Ae
MIVVWADSSSCQRSKAFFVSVAPVRCALIVFCPPCSFVRLPHFLRLCLALGRLYVKGVMMGFKRGLRNQHEHTSLLKIDKVVAKEDTAYYLGKRVCFIYKAQKEIRGTKFRTIWGRITRPHGSGSVFTLYLCLDAPTLHPSHLREKQQSHGSDGFA